MHRADREVKLFEDFTRPLDQEAYGTYGKGRFALSELEARISAEAAAAVEQPARGFKGGGRRGGARFPAKGAQGALQQQLAQQDEMTKSILAAQSEAANRRRFDIESAQSQAASIRRGYGDSDLIPAPRKGKSSNIDRMIYGAQAAALGQTHHQNHLQYVSFTPEDFLGNWVDSHGNSVLVYSSDAWEVRLTAAISRPQTGRDSNLSIRQLPDESWTCGNSWLDMDASSTEQLHWVAADGRHSVWARGRT